MNEARAQATKTAVQRIRRRRRATSPTQSADDDIDIIFPEVEEGADRENENNTRKEEKEEEEESEASLSDDQNKKRKANHEEQVVFEEDDEAQQQTEAKGTTSSASSEASSLRQEKQVLLDKLKQEVIAAHLPLSEDATSCAFGRGNPDADILFIGESPGAHEDRSGVPFSGPAGRKLASALASIGIDMDDVYICNVLKYMPPNNRDPNQAEVLAHTPYLLRQLHIVSPKLIVPLGNWATKYVLSGFNPRKMNQVEGMMKTHGMRVTITSHLTGDTFQAIPCFHPASVLHQQQWEPLFQQDMQNIKAYVESPGFKNLPKKEVPFSSLEAASSAKAAGLPHKKKQRTIDSFFAKKA